METKIRCGSMLLMCIAMVAAAIMVAFGVALAAQGSKLSTENLLREELARTAVRIGVRHAMAVAIDRLDAPYVTGEWALRDFGDLERDNPANPAPYGGNIDPTSFTANPYGNSDDNVHPESRLYYLDQAWSAHVNAGYSFTGTDDWPWPTTYSGNCFLLNPCTPRWIEPGYYNPNGLTNPVRFTEVPSATPAYDTPMYYDQRWRPVSSRDLARYRLRYAVAPLDLGGHLLWGRQLDFDASGSFNDANATPHEWDERIARAYLTSLGSILSKGGFGDDGSDPRSQILIASLGRGSGGANNTRNPQNYLVGFDPGPTLRLTSSLGICAPGSPTTISSPINQEGTGGPISWFNAYCLLGQDSGYSAQYTMTPFGHATEYSANPNRYYQAYTECPWRINILTAPAYSVYAILHGYLPQVVDKSTVTSASYYHWVGYTHPAFPAPSVPQWQTAAYLTVPKNPPIPGGPVNPGPDVQTAGFQPPSWSQPQPPFSGFSKVDYSAAVTATAYDALYPGPPADFEDYAQVELHPAYRVKPASDAQHPIGKYMLGSTINVYNVTDGSVAWTPANSLAPGTCTSIFNDNAWNTSLAGSMSTAWLGSPFEPMRGSSAWLAYNKPWGSSVKPIGADRVEWTEKVSDRFYHRDSYWLDLLFAMAESVTLAKALHQDASWVGAAAIPVYAGSAGAPAKPTSIEDIDRLFLSILGEWFPGDVNAPGSTATSKPSWAVVCGGAQYTDFTGKSRSPRYIVDFTSSANIRQVAKDLANLKLGDGSFAFTDSLQIKRKLACMERVLNDWRLSFLGANGTYVAFRPFDFDGDGYACCSCYTGTGSHPSLSLSNGVSIPAAPAMGGVAIISPPSRFSLTGFLVFDKARYIRALVRGQVWDELRQQAVAEANLETVFALDPDGDYDPTTRIGLADDCTLYQRWKINLYGGEMQRNRN